MSVTIKDLEDRARKLDDIRKFKAELEAEEKDLREFFKSYIGEKSSALAGSYIVTLTNRERKDLDRDAARKLLGERYSELEKKTSYQVLEVKKV
jgi:hypothetical protein